MQEHDELRSAQEVWTLPEEKNENMQIGLTPDELWRCSSPQRVSITFTGWINHGSGWFRHGRWA